MPHNFWFCFPQWPRSIWRRTVWQPDRECALCFWELSTRAIIGSRNWKGFPKMMEQTDISDENQLVNRVWTSNILNEGFEHHHREFILHERPVRRPRCTPPTPTHKSKTHLLVNIIRFHGRRLYIILRMSGFEMKRNRIGATRLHGPLPICIEEKMGYELEFAISSECGGNIYGRIIVGWPRGS